MLGDHDHDHVTKAAKLRLEIIVEIAKNHIVRGIFGCRRFNSQSDKTNPKISTHPPVDDSPHSL